MSSPADLPRTPNQKRRWLQFGLRTLLIFTTICAIGCAWLARKIEQKRKERDAVEAIVKLGGSVTYDYEKVRGAKPPGPDWLRKFLGENFFSEVEGVTISGNAVLTDAGSANLKWLTQLQTLNLGYSNISDAGLVNLSGLIQLRTLNLNFTKITDVGLVNLNRLTQLHTLD